jgi:hypothetical protein
MWGIYNSGGVTMRTPILPSRCFGGIIGVRLAVSRCSRRTTAASTTTSCPVLRQAPSCKTPWHGLSLDSGYPVRSIRHSDLAAGKTPVLHVSAVIYRRIVDTPLYREDTHVVVVPPDGQIVAECI